MLLHWCGCVRVHVHAYVRSFMRMSACMCEHVYVCFNVCMHLLVSCDFSLIIIYCYHSLFFLGGYFGCLSATLMTIHSSRHVFALQQRYFIRISTLLVQRVFIMLEMDGPLRLPFWHYWNHISRYFSHLSCVFIVCMCMFLLCYVSLQYCFIYSIPFKLFVLGSWRRPLHRWRWS